MHLSTYIPYVDRMDAHAMRYGCSLSENNVGQGSAGPGAEKQG